MYSSAGNKMGLGGHQAEEYVCQLPESEKKKALEELREDDNIREQSLQQFREWINKHPNIKRCRTGKCYEHVLNKQVYVFNDNN